MKLRLDYIRSSFNKNPKHVFSNKLKKDFKA